MELKKTIMLIEVKSSPIHGKGLFAKKNIRTNTKIIEYVGEIITKKQGDKRAEKQYNSAKESKTGFVYVFELNKSYDLDGNVPYNIARFINHSCTPNCKYIVKHKRVWIISIKPIKKGEEITYDYGYDIDNHKEHPCNCRSSECSGFIISKRAKEKLKRITSKTL
jgi:SET domain-containing protein